MSVRLRNHDTDGRLDGEYECMEITASPHLEIKLVRGYRSLILSGAPYDFRDLGKGVDLREGRRYRITIEEI